MMADTADLELDIGGTYDGDLKLTAGDFSLVNETYRVRQALQIALQLFRGEWFLNINAGVPYYDNILGQKVQDIGDLDSVIKAAIRAVADVNRIIAWESSFNDATRVYTVAFTVDTTFGPIEYGGVLP
jgi:hypothetical protein